MFGFDWAAGFISPFKDADGSSYTTPDAAISALLDILGAEENLIVDLGSGDGRFVLAAARRGLRARGIELDSSLVAASRAEAINSSLEENATFEEASLLDAELPSDATLIAYLLPAALQKLARRLVANKHSGRLFVIRWSTDLENDGLSLIAQHPLIDGWVAREYRYLTVRPHLLLQEPPHGLPPPAASLIVMTSPAKRPERLPLLRRTIESCIRQKVRGSDGGIGARLELLVLDDQPECAAWPTVAAALPLAQSYGVDLRYIPLPPDTSTNRVNMRLKRNAGLLLSKGAVVVFCDDDDWRSH